MDLLHHLPVDTVSYVEEPIAVDPMNGGRQQCGDAGDEMPIVSIERMTWTHDGKCRPCAATPSYRSDQHVPLTRPMCVANEAGQDVEIPARLLWQRKEKLGLLMSRTERRDTAVSGLKKVARIAERMTERLLRIADVFQMCREVIDEFERGEFPFHLEHAG